jgi:alkylation response protein AidB-like acyl-CoA dehydrogenase
MIERGWYGVNLPVEVGGLGRSAHDRAILVEEFERVGAPHLDLTITSLAPIIARFGTEANRRTWLPPIMRGEVVMALGYSEPDAGSDLASLRTAAVADGDQWVISGQKIWNSRAHLATHEWMAVRTDPEAPRHHGISVIVVPLDSPGIEIRPLYTWGYGRTNLTFFDHVRVPRENLIGRLNEGWRYVSGALDFERVALGSVGDLLRLYDRLLEHCLRPGPDGARPADRQGVQDRLAELDAELSVARLFGYRTASLIDAGMPLSAEASIQKVFSSELRTRLAEAALEIVGPEALLGQEAPHAPLGGLAEEVYRAAPMLRFGGGTNEVMRDLIARRGLGLPRG